MYGLVEVISAGLTVATIIMSIIVVAHWRKDAVCSIKNKNKLNAEQWFIIGVFIGFIGQSLDNSYWLIAWSAHYIDNNSTYTKWLFDNGVYFNIPFRQLSGLIAAYCHVRAAVEYSKKRSKTLEKTVLTALIVGGLYSLSLVFIK